MIDKKDSRIGIFGASETSVIMMPRETKTYQTFIRKKAGLIEKKEIDNVYVDVGNFLEHDIIDFLNVEGMKKDSVFWDEKINLRANLDGNTDDCIYEIKTRKYSYSFTDFKPPKIYWEQVQVQMFCSGIKKAKLCIYYLLPYDYDKPWEIELDKKNLKTFKIKYDENFIKKYLKKIKIANEDLRKIKGEK